MALPTPQVFKTNTSPRGMLGKLGGGYGNNMIKVLSALEAYSENRNAPMRLREALLYTLWKVCRQWLDLKKDKQSSSELFLRRKLNVELLRDEALAELARVSPRLHQALGRYDQAKGRGAQNGLKSLHGQYGLERALYEGNNKRTSPISLSMVDAKLASGGSTRQDRQMAPLVQKGFGNLSLDDCMHMKKVFGDELPPVVYLNKIARLKHMVTVQDGSFYDVNGDPVFMRDQWQNQLTLTMYAMDKYGNLYLKPVENGNALQQFVEEKENGKLRLNGTTQFNHSSFMAGADVICAGLIHIGYDNRRGFPVPGVLSAIDNASGHYKPTTANLQRCLEMFKAQGVDVSYVRVGDWSHRPATYCWGKDFLAGNRLAWPDHGTALKGSSLCQAPPISNSI